MYPTLWPRSFFSFDFTYEYYEVLGAITFVECEIKEYMF